MTIGSISFSAAAFPSNRVSAVVSDASPTMFNGVTAPSKEEYQEYLDNLTPEELEKKAFFDELIQEEINNPQKPTRAATKISLSNTFKINRQNNGYYCVPACVQSTFTFANGSSPSQDNIASNLGTEEIFGGTEFSTNITKYLNKNQSRCTYMLSVGLDQPALCTLIKNNINSAAPVLLSLKNVNKSDWKYYDAKGHCVIANAIYSDYYKIGIADPIGRFYDSVPSYYEVDTPIVANYCNACIY